MARPRKPENAWRPPHTVEQHGIIYHRPTKTRLGTTKDPRSLIWSRYEDIAGEHPSDTLGWLVSQYFESEKFRTLSQRTQQDYRKDFARVLKARIRISGAETILATVPLARITPVVMQAYHTARAYPKSRPGAPIRANRELKALSGVFRWGMSPVRRLCTHNPCKGLEWHLEKPRERDVQPWEYDLVYRLAQPEYVQIAMELAYLCVAREGEILSLDLRQISDSGILMQRTKRSKPNTITWTPRLRRAVDRAIEIRRGFPVVGTRLLLNTKGQPISGNAFRNAFGKTMKRAMQAGLAEPFTFHDIKAFGYTHHADGHRAAGHRSDMSRVYRRGTDSVEATE